MSSREGRWPILATAPAAYSLVMEQPALVVCNVCGVTASAADRLTWLVEVDPRRGRLFTCPECARRLLRSIEAKLDPEYW